MKAKSLKIQNSALILLDEYDCENQFNLVDNRFRISFGDDELFTVEELNAFGNHPAVQAFPLDYRDPDEISLPVPGKYFPIFKASAGTGAFTPIGIADIMDIGTDDRLLHRQEVLYTLAPGEGGIEIGMVSGLPEVLLVSSPGPSSDFGPKLKQQPLE